MPRRLFARKTPQNPGVPTGVLAFGSMHDVCRGVVALRVAC